MLKYAQLRATRYPLDLGLAGSLLEKQGSADLILRSAAFHCDGGKGRGLTKQARATIVTCACGLESDGVVADGKPRTLNSRSALLATS